MKKHASINDLPNELLLVIFQLLYKMHQKKEMRYPFVTPKEFCAGDPFAPSMFPFAQAKVCQRWCTLLVSYPMYWTYIPIAVDPTPTPLRDVANYFRWSQDLPVQVVVRSHPHAHNVQDPDEKSRVASVLPYISQHLHHITDIQFSLLHHASIPDLHHWLVGQADVLTSINLSHTRDEEPAMYVCEDDGNHEDDGDQLELHFSAPILSTLSIGLRTFARACNSNKTWLANAPRLRRLSLTPSGRCFPMEYFSIGTTIQALSHVTGFGSVSVRGVHFVDDYALFEPPPTFSASSMTFEDLKGTDVATFVDAGVEPLDSLSIKNCSLLNLNDFYARTLFLTDLDEDCDLTEPFSNLDTLKIVLDNCPAFNDTVLDFMADSGLTGGDFPAKGMGTLSLRRCSNFKIESLYQMILARRTAMEESPSWDGTMEGLAPGDSDELSAIVSLRVTGGPFLSDSHRAAFEELVPDFQWTSTEADINDTSHS